MRAHVVRVAVAALAVALLAVAGPVGLTGPSASGANEVAGTQYFADVPPSHAFSDEIGWMALAGISTGTPNPPGLPLFKPTELVTREALAAFLYRDAGSPAVAPAVPVFADVDGSHPFFRAIQWMAQTGLSTGIPQPGGKPLFKPADPVTRQATSAFLWRYSGSPQTASTVPAFYDHAAGAPFFDAVQWTARAGVTMGYYRQVNPNSDADPYWAMFFDGAKPVERQAVAAFLYRLAFNDRFEDCSTVAHMPASDCEALLAIYAATDRNIRDGAGSWMIGPDPCGWTGVTCLGGRVSELEIIVGDGVLAPELVDLTALTRLWVFGSGEFAGQIPSDVGNLAALHWVILDGISGAIPDSLGHLPELATLEITGLGVAGALPATLGSSPSLSTISIHDTSLSGPIPSGLAAHKRVDLDLYRNDLSGAVPVGLLDNVQYTFRLFGNGCLTAATPELAAYLTGKDSKWNDGCIAP